MSGVLGTINNEHFDDMTKSDNTITTLEDDFVDSWKIPENCTSIITENSVQEPNPTCEQFFKQKTSYFATCFAIVNPDPFYDICLKLVSLPLHQNSSTSLQQACTAGISYIEACSIENVPIRVPDTCIQ